MASRRNGRIPREITPKSLESAALAYLQRYATSTENLRTVLMRRVLRSAKAHHSDRAEGTAWVESIIVRYRDAGLLDDLAYAQGRAASLHRRGVSLRGIRARLGAKGVAADDIDAALAHLQETCENAEFEAACNYARRRRLGPWRAEDRSERRERDLAALARQGFAYELALRVVDADDATSLESESGSN